MQILLHNKDLWWRTGNRPKPILMICFTNHALDQFLDLCIKECHLNSGVVRIGGRCKSPNLEHFLLRKIKQSIKEERKVDSSIFYQLKDQQKNLKNLQQRINTEISYQQLCDEGLLKLKALAQIVPPQYLSQFSSDGQLLAWLGFTDLNALNESSSQNKEALVNNQEDFEEEQNTEAAAAVDIEEENEEDDDDEERLLDEDIIEVKASKKSNKNNEKDVGFKTQVTDYIADKPELIFTEKEIKEIFNKNDSEWVTVGSTQNNEIKYFKKILSYNADRDIMTHDLWCLRIDDRLALYKHWSNEFRNIFRETIETLKNEYNKISTEINELRMQEDRMVMQNSFIIAMTTTGSARYHNILKDIGPKIVIVEEAAEVFESHIVSALSKDCEHLILIGDHVQLRPKPNVYELEKDYRLDVSLFERLLLNGAKHVSLTCQHRMRPEISVLMKHFYNFEIKNHESVFNFENVLGLKKNIFFVTHTHPEQSSDNKSRSNQFEADYLNKFATFLIKQRYTQSQITILTTYLGQMFLIKSILKTSKATKDIRVCTVDNYQGEENDIILLSLVRSNNENRIGFLKIENRICVALSRARKGLYCIGNFSLLNNTSAKQQTKWSAIIQTLVDQKSIDTGLPLSCGHHPQNDLKAVAPSDFDKRPEGGCNVGCEYRLSCGHTCSYFCHLYDPNHEFIKCTKLCEKVMPCHHQCRQKCGHDGPCKVEMCKEIVERTLKPCNHKQKVPCNKPLASIICKSMCRNILNCGHNCHKSCSISPCEPCTEKVSVESICKHNGLMQIDCSNNNKIWTYQEYCNKNCSSELGCGHLCKTKCSECFAGRIHSSCAEKCDRILVCGHKCQVPCARQVNLL